MKNSIIVDTSALIAYFIQSEKKHQCVNSYIKTHPKQEWIIVSTVFSEIMTWLRLKVHPRHAIPIGSFLREQCYYHPITPSEDEVTWDIYKTYSDKKWSFTDCSLLAVSKEENVPLILSIDHHFHQMKSFGITVVPDE